MKKSRTVMNVMLFINAIAELVFPFVMLFVVFATEPIVYWSVIVLMVLIILGTAIVANIMAGYSVRTRWGAAVLPPSIIWFSGILLSTGYGISSEFWAMLIISVVYSLVCVATILLAMKLHSKKFAMQAPQNNQSEKENNETV